MTWSIIKSSDRETMIDELERLKPLADAANNAQRARAVSFALAEVRASKNATPRIQLSGSAIDGNHYVSIVIDHVATPSWQIKKSTRASTRIARTHELAENRKTMISALSDKQTGQRGRAFTFAAAELASSGFAHSAINARGDESGLILSVSSAD